jgi:hypothetical protein
MKIDVLNKLQYCTFLQEIRYYYLGAYEYYALEIGA